MKLDKWVIILAAVAAPVIALGVDLNWFSGHVGADIAAVVAAFVGAYHLPNDAARAALAAQEAPPATPGDLP